MGILIGCEQVSHEWPTKTVLKDVTIGVNEGDRIGIVGKNGDGKSTLLQLIGHTLEPSSGQIIWRNNIRVGMLGQADNLQDEATVEHEVVGDMPEYEWASNPEIRRIIAELIGDVDWRAQIKTLSGGQRRRVDLTRLLIGTWDVLLLDEPTNHLDMRAITWLASHLKNRWAQNAGALLIVTHDRWFLDEVCLNMWEVHDRAIDPFEGGYSAYIQQRLERQRQAAVMEERRQNMLRKELAWLSRGAQARTSKPKFRIKEAQAMIADVPPMRNTLELKRMAVSRLGKQVFEVKGASVVLGERTIINNLDWLIGPGERFGILGENGAGKTTLLKLLQGKIKPTHGTVKVGKSVKLGILSQHIDLLADKQDWRVRELLARYKKTYTIGGKDYTPTKLLENLGFDTRELDTPIADLSGGQARRLALMCVLMDEPNVLILDEPGNDLDTDMLAVMEDLLDSWPGTLLLVTHDRYLMERVTDDQYALIGGTITHCPGGVEEYLKLIQNRPATTPSFAAPAKDAPAKKAETKQSGLSSSEQWKLNKELASLERKIETQTGRIEELRSAMTSVDPTDFVALSAAQADIDEAQERLDELELSWLEISEKLSE